MLIAGAALVYPTAGDAHAQCDEPPALRGPQEVTPATSASGVPLNAIVVARYSEGYFEVSREEPSELVELYDCADDFPAAWGGSCEVTGAPVAGRVSVAGDRLFFEPIERLRANQIYAGFFRGAEQDLDIVFTTGALEDTQAPQMGTVLPPSSTDIEESCENPDGGVRIAVRFEPAVDDSSEGSLEYLLYQTRGEGITAPILQSRLRHFASDELVMAFVIPPDQALETACVVVRVVDGVGLADESEAVCFEPLQGPYFEPLCSAAPVRGGASWLGLPLLLWGFARRRRAR